ncbi:DNA-binding protein RFX6 [Trichonephila clavipes]|nr:DNA-binding protein RFX6 [Trichonephila clavipes]
MDNILGKSFNGLHGMESSLETDASRQGTSSFHSKEKKYYTRSLKDKKRQSVQTLHWLKLNYCSCPDVCLPREIIYEHYLEFCKNEKIVPACKATFGKLIRNTFPHVTSKRLGARGHSKYHYNGIGIKQNSEYCQPIQTDRGITRFSSCMSNKNEQGSSKKFSLASKVGTLLPNFPDINELNFSDSVNKEKNSSGRRISGKRGYSLDGWASQISRPQPSKSCLERPGVGNFNSTPPPRTIHIRKTELLNASGINCHRNA